MLGSNSSFLLILQSRIAHPKFMTCLAQGRQAVIEHGRLGHYWTSPRHSVSWLTLIETEYLFFLLCGICQRTKDLIGYMWAFLFLVYSSNSQWHHTAFSPERNLSSGFKMGLSYFKNTYIQTESPKVKIYSHHLLSRFKKIILERLIFFRVSE